MSLPFRLESWVTHRRSFAVLGVLVLGAIPADAFRTGGWTPEAVAVRAIWGLGYLVLAAVYPRLPAHLANHGSVIGVCWALLWFFPLLHFTGGAQSPLFAWHLGVPLGVAVLVQTSTPTVLLASVLTLGSLLLQGYGAMSGAAFGTMFFSATVASLLALLGSRLATANQNAIREAERQKVEAVRALEDSKRAALNAERLAMIGQLASGVAHEINNPLAYVSANLSYLRSSAKVASEDVSPEDFEQAFEEASEGLGRIKAIVKELKSFTREASPELEPVDSGAALQEALRLTASRLRAIPSVQVELPEKLPRVHGNEHQLVEVFLHLLVNAVEALERPGVPSPALRVRASAEGDVLTVIIEDSGGGIPPALRSRIFQPFFTTKPPGKGTGLGLALAREYVVRFGGALIVENAEPTGARFIVRLPTLR